MDNGCKRAVLVWHRRSGKDKSLLNIVIQKMLERVGMYYYLFPTYTQGKKILWEGIDGNGFKFIEHFPASLVTKKNEQGMKIEIINGSGFQIIGTDNIDSIVGTNPVGCVFSEFSLQDPKAWALLRPILKENGGWAIFNFTPRGKNHGWDILEVAKKNGWFWQLLTIKDTCREDGSPIITTADIEQERKEGMSDEMIEQEYFCSFSGAIDGAYYGKIMAQLEEQGRFTRGLYDPNLQVDTWWDLGMDDAMAILFTQTVGKEIRFIDYEENSGEGLAFYAKLLSGKPYVYRNHHFPHDAAVRELGTGKSRQEVAQGLGIKPITIVQRPEAKEDGIQAVRSVLPRVFFDIEKCSRLRDCLLNYSKKWDEVNKCWKNNPRHDWTSHGADAVQTFALGYKEQVKTTKSPIKVRYDHLGRPIIEKAVDEDDIFAT